MCLVPCLCRFSFTKNSIDCDVACYAVYVMQVFPPVSSVEALVWCGNRLFSAGIDEFVYEHNTSTGSIKVCILLFYRSAN